MPSQLIYHTNSSLLKNSPSSCVMIQLQTCWHVQIQTFTIRTSGVRALFTHLVQHDAVEWTTAPAGLQSWEELERPPDSSGK